MALNELFLEIYICILCLNGGILVVDYLQDIPLISPFDSSVNVTAVTQPSIFNSTNATGTLVTNVTTNARNDTNSALLNPIQDYFFYPLQILWTFVQFLTGAFIWQALAIFGMPSILIFVLQGVLGLLLARTIFYYMTGR